MARRALLPISPVVVPSLDPGFIPASLWNREYRKQVTASGLVDKIAIALERDEGSFSYQEIEIFDYPSSEAREANLFYTERMVKNLLWMRGGWRLFLFGPPEIVRPLAKVYSGEGKRAFDVDLMTRAYQRQFKVEIIDSLTKMPSGNEKSKPLGGHLDGFRLGFDLGASDWKVASVAEGEVVFTAEFPWAPTEATDPSYHYHHLQAALHLAAAHLPRVEAIGGSAAGIYVNNEPRVASLFRGVSPTLFEPQIKPIFHQLQKEWAVPFEVANDGEVAALAGSMAFKATRLLAISLGSSEAGGYVNEAGYITDWLNELAFVPVDYRLEAPVDEWSGDRGCGVQYFSQQAVFRLAHSIGLRIDETLPGAEKLKQVQNYLEKGETKARLIFETIGIYLGYEVAHYADFYDLSHIFLLGRVTSGEAGLIILEKAQEVLTREFPELAQRIQLHLPDERSRRLSQAMSAASLPLLSNSNEKRRNQGKEK